MGRGRSRYGKRIELWDEYGHFVATPRRNQKVVEVRLMEDEGTLLFEARFPNGYKVQDTDINKLRRRVREYNEGLADVAWERVLIIEVEDQPYFHSDKNEASLSFSWKPAEAAKLKGGKLVYRDDEGQRLTFSRRTQVTAVPWTEKREATLTEIQDTLQRFATKLAELMEDARIADKLDNVQLPALLASSTTSNNNSNSDDEE